MHYSDSSSPSHHYEYTIKDYCDIVNNPLNRILLVVPHD